MLSDYDIMKQSRPMFQIMTQGQRYRIHMASLEILERIGARYYEPEAIEMLGDAGASVEKNGVIRIPSYLVSEALATVPKRVVISDRAGEPSLYLEGHNFYCGPGTDTTNIIDAYSGERRPTVRQDIVNTSILCDYLPNIDFVACMGNAYDIPESITDRYHFADMLTNTTKPILHTAWSLEGLKDIFEMCIAVAGDPEKFRRNPFIMHYAEPSSPLKHSAEAMQKLLFCAEKGIPLIYASGPVAGASSPVTIAGTLALTNAEWLSGLVVSQLKRKGAPLIYGGGITPLDMLTTIATYSSPSNRLDNIALKEMAAYYGVPDFCEGGCSDSKVFDHQAACETMFSLMCGVLAGNSLIHDVGYLEYGLTACYEELILADEIIAMLKDFIKGIEVNDETLALDVIAEIGIGGDFFSHDHTLNNFKKALFYPKYFDRKNYEAWINDGSKDLGQVLNEKVKRVLENHKPEPLDTSTQEEIWAVLKRSEDKLTRS